MNSPTFQALFQYSAVRSIRTGRIAAAGLASLAAMPFHPIAKRPPAATVAGEVAHSGRRG